MPIALPSSIDVLILTPIAIEFEAIRSLMQSTYFFTDTIFSKSYCTGFFQRGGTSAKIVLRETGSGHLAIAKAVQEGMQLFKPQLLVLFGTAGGLRKVQTGDIIIATAGSSYESGRVVDDGFYNNIRSLPTHQRIREKATILAKQPAYWKKQATPEIAADVNTYFGPIVSGDKVIASDYAPLRQLLRERHYDALALEMEAYAFLDIAQSYPDTETLIVRGISDLLGDKNEANLRGSKALAVANAAAFLRALLLLDDVIVTTLPHRISRKRMTMLFGLVAVLSVFSLFWIKSPRVGALTTTTPFSIDTVLQEKAPSSLAANDKETTIPAPNQPAPTSKSTIQPKIAEALPTKENESPITAQPTTLFSGDKTVADADTAAYNSPLGNLTTVDTTNNVVPESVAELPTFIFKIYLEDQNGKTIRGATYLIDGKPVQLVRNKAHLTAGVHQLEIHYRNHEPIKTLINVPSLNNEQTIQQLFLP